MLAGWILAFLSDSATFGALVADVELDIPKKYRERICGQPFFSMVNKKYKI
jgi:hypothetical protein